MTWFLGLFRGLWGYAAAVLAGALAVLAVFRSGKSAGQNEVVVESLKKEVENVRTANEVEREVAGADPAARRERLRDGWTRD